MDAARQRHVIRRRAEVMQKQPSQVTGGHAEPIGQRVHCRFVQRAVGDESQRARYNARRAEPRGRARRRFRMAAKTRAESSRLRGGRGREIADVRVLWCPRRANRAAIHARRGDGNKKPAVEPRVARSSRAIARALIEEHAPASLSC